ncbi:MAG: hypothetical protein M9945_14315 [Aquamicrobium sp.]|uniref:hypothetical protein n=1 Tax=Aquamicrobium sp. TaxID=1872579 RepID=UPI00349E6265|nr:hypothetical protein [Aquamicrobium sp.]
MKIERTVKFLKMLGAKVPLAQKRAGWIVSDCPLGPWRHEGGKSSPEVFGVKREGGDAFCNCFACGYHGRMSDLVLEMQMLNGKQPEIAVKWSEINALIEEAENDDLLDLDFPDIEEVLFGAKEELHLFPEWWLDSFPPWREVTFAREYLKNRDVPAGIADKLDIRADTKDGERRVCFPVRDFEGRLVGLHGRAIEEGANPRYRMYLQAKRNNPIVWYGESWVDRSKPILVVEGPFDVASVLKVYDNVVSPLFVNPSAEKIRRMADALEVYTLFDRGKGGDAGREKFAAVLGKTHVLVHLMVPEGLKDPGACSPAALFDILHEVLPGVEEYPCNPPDFSQICN